MRALALATLLLAACATTSSQSQRHAVSSPPTAPTCVVRERMLAPVARHPRAAVLRALDVGLALVWSEHEGEHDALRLLVVDAKGLPKSASVEVVDRDAVLSAPEVTAGKPDGFVVSWSEPSGRFERTLDARGRARGDVAEATGASAAPAVPQCGRQPEHLSCTTSDGPMQIPHDEEPIAAAPNGAVVSLSPSGLRLFLNECAKH